MYFKKTGYPVIENDGTVSVRAPQNDGTYKVMKTGFIPLDGALTSARKSTDSLQGFAYYQIICNDGACDDCAAHNGAIYPVAYADDPDYYPPFHPNCKCTVQGYFVDNPYFHPMDSGNLTADPWKREIEFWLGITFGGLSPGQQAGMLINYYDITDYTTEEIAGFLASISEVMHVRRRIEAFLTWLNMPEPAVTIAGWLHLYESPTVFTEGRVVEMPDNFDRNYWYAFEDLDDYNPWARYMIEDVYQETGVAIVGGYGEVIDDQGRYWVAVGPNVMNPNHRPDEKVTLEEMQYGTNIDVILRDDQNNLFYLPARVGEVKNHTYPDGILQTGDSFPNAAESVDTGRLGAPVEFVGAILPSGLGDYEIIRIIVYEQIKEG